MPFYKRQLKSIILAKFQKTNSKKQTNNKLQNSKPRSNLLLTIRLYRNSYFIFTNLVQKFCLPAVRQQI